MPPGFRTRGKVFHTAGGTQVRSGYEKTVIEDLERRNVAFEYEPDTLEILLPTRGIVCVLDPVLHGAQTQAEHYKKSTYTIDIRLANGRYVELKGKFTAKDRGRILALVRAWGEKFPRPISLLLQKDNWLTKAHKRKYSDWARQVGIDVHVGNSIPEEWLA